MRRAGEWLKGRPVPTRRYRLVLLALSTVVNVVAGKKRVEENRELRMRVLYLEGVVTSLAAHLGVTAKAPTPE